MYTYLDEKLDSWRGGGAEGLSCICGGGRQATGAHQGLSCNDVWAMGPSVWVGEGVSGWVGVCLCVIHCEHFPLAGWAGQESLVVTSVADPEQFCADPDPNYI